ncbi:MAG: tRNA pseudouridine(38-40) synthase TruA [Deltaproteobacteria bacterium]|nr:tRNA pseudouridine(38-40) synthase TruA [Deltaproteobacteria bacterium]
MVDFFSQICGEFPAWDVPFLPAEPERAPGAPRRLALVTAYRGDGFAGWQLQARGLTVQGALEKVLSKVLNQPIRVFAAGRTDAGVHALGQVAAFSTTSNLSLARLDLALRKMLPDGVLPRRLGPVAPDFHPQYDARGKTYHYYLLPETRAGLFAAGLMWPLPGRLDLAAMAKALELVTGLVDLGAFANNSTEVKGSTQRLITRAELRREDSGVVRLSLTGNGFLRHAVRNLVGSLVQVGGGRLAPEAVGEMLAAGQRLYSGPKAPPGGLYLARIYYVSPLPGADGAAGAATFPGTGSGGPAVG